MVKLPYMYNSVGQSTSQRKGKSLPEYQKQEFNTSILPQPSEYLTPERQLPTITGCRRKILPLSTERTCTDFNNEMKCDPFSTCRENIFPVEADYSTSEYSGYTSREFREKDWSESDEFLTMESKPDLCVDCGDISEYSTSVCGQEQLLPRYSAVENGENIIPEWVEDFTQKQEEKNSPELFRGKKLRHISQEVESVSNEYECKDEHLINEMIPEHSTESNPEYETSENETFSLWNQGSLVPIHVTPEREEGTTSEYVREENITLSNEELVIPVYKTPVKVQKTNNQASQDSDSEHSRQEKDQQVCYNPLFY